MDVCFGRVDQVQHMQRQELTFRTQVEKDRQIVAKIEAQLRDARDLVKSSEERIAGLQGKSRKTAQFDSEYPKMN